MNKLLILILLSIPVCCVAQSADILDGGYGYRGELILIYKDSLDTGLTDRKKIMLDTLAQRMENWAYKGYFVTKLYCYYTDDDKKEFDRRIRNIILYLRKKHKVDHDYFEFIYVNLKDEKFPHSRLEHILIGTEYKEELKNPYK